MIKLVGARSRPEPPSSPEVRGGEFLPAPELATWATSVFLQETGPFYTEEHEHLLDARIVWCWASTPGRARGRDVIGEAELAEARNRTWGKLRGAAQLEDWWRLMPGYDADAAPTPDFLITLYAPWCANAEDASFCALVDHELFHCGIDRDDYGLPKISVATGRPQYAIMGHDVEEFIGVVRRWGADALPEVKKLVRAAAREPEIAKARIAAGCGTCRSTKRAA